MSALTVAALTAAGGLGAVCRFLVDLWVTGWLQARVPARRAHGHPRPDLPVGTLVVNATACLALGLVTAALAPRLPVAASVVGTGFLGGYSTFSTACVEGARLVLAGQVAAGLAHAAAMAAVCLAAVAAGLALGGA